MDRLRDDLPLPRFARVRYEPTTETVKDPLAMVRDSQGQQRSERGTGR
jgi:hypothetical protein